MRKNQLLDFLCRFVCISILYDDWGKIFNLNLLKFQGKNLYDRLMLFTEILFRLRHVSKVSLHAVVECRDIRPIRHSK